MGKKRKFSVQLHVLELSAVPYMTGVFFFKAKHTDHSHTSLRVPIAEHTIRFDETVAFEAKLGTESGTLTPSLVRLSLRMERKGGKSMEKLGIVEVNLAEFAGKGREERRYLLQSEKKAEQGRTNSILRVAVEMSLSEGDPVFRAMEPQEDVRGIDSPGGSREVLAVDAQFGQLDLEDLGGIPHASFPRRAPRSPRGSSHHRGHSWHNSRVQADDVVASIFSQTQTEPRMRVPSAGNDELKLYLGHDGKATVEAPRVGRRGSAVGL